MLKKITKLFKNSETIPIDKSSKIVIMSDCHRGSGDNYDNFLKNKNIYNSALNYYYDNGYTYIELGDGDDMWEVKDYNNIINEHIDTYRILKKFNNKKRLKMIYGNHDICKRNKYVLKKYFNTYYDNKKNKRYKLLYDLRVTESLILKYKEYDIFLLHGHQVDFLNGVLWKLSRFLVRNLWRILEHYALKDPTQALRNNKRKRIVEKRLNKWSYKNKKIIISGHTHNSSFPLEKSLYFNAGSCIHPNGVSSIEIYKGIIKLNKWEYTINKDNLVTVKKTLIQQKSIENVFKDLKTDFNDKFL